MSLEAEIRRGAAILAATAQEPRRDASLLLRHVLGVDRAWQLSHPEAELTETQSRQYQALLARRAQHEPIQYIVGMQEFYGLPLHVTPAVLIPRPETEHLVEAVLARLPADRSVRIADVGTGSGAIAFALAHTLPLAHIDALDISPEALQIAKENAQSLRLAERVCFLHSDLLAAVAEHRYDCIVSNPPYVPDTEVLELQVADWEPHGALFAGSDGLAVYRRLLRQAEQLLKPGGLLALELGAGQSEALAALFREDGTWTGLTFLPDLAGILRVAVAGRG